MSVTRRFSCLPSLSLVGLCAGWFSAACGQPSENLAQERAESAQYAAWPDPLAALPRGSEQTARVCARPADDIVRDALCSGLAAPTSLAELQARLGVGADQIGGVNAVKTGEMRGISVTAHSTALSKRSVSAINPRVVAVHIGFTPNTQIGVPRDLATRMFALAFTRGEQSVEMVASDRSERRYNFYVVGFRQACNDQPGGCKPGDLLTDSIESNWTEASLYDEVDLANTVLDCATCHQPDGPGTPKLLRMQELDSPWTHWLSPNTEGGRLLLEDYLKAHADETYAGMPSSLIERADPNSVATLAFLATSTQPNEFSSLLVEREIKESAAAMGGNQPADNSIPGVSPTWMLAFEAASRGEAIPVPYPNVKVTDAAKLAQMTAVYQAQRSGQLPAAELPDIRDVFPDDPARLADMGFTTPPGLDGAGVLLSACAQCHNARLDQSQSRARFRADLQGMTREEKDLAIARLQLPADNPAAMPPARLRILTPEARARAIEILQR